MEFSGYKLKTKAYFIICNQHSDNYMQLQTKIILPSCNMPNLLNDIGFEVSTETKFEKILNELLTGSFDGYASVLFFVEFECICNADKQLARFYDVINENPQLKYVTKIVITDSHFKLEFTETQIFISCLDGGKRMGINLDSEHVLREGSHSSEEIAHGYIVKKVLMRTYGSTANLAAAISKYLIMKTPMVDNLTVLQCNAMGSCDSCGNKYRFAEFLEHLFKLAMLNSVQELASKCLIDMLKESNSITQNPLRYFNHIMIKGVLNYFFTTTTAGCYVFNINPALAIFINHLSFSNYTIRTESLYDLKKLRETFMGKKIPHLVLRDSSAEDVKRLMSEVQTINFKGLKYLYIFVLSHGGVDDMIHTKTISYNINKEIIAPLMANATLEKVQKFVLINACRGSYDPRYAAEGEELELQPPELIEGNEKLVKLYSTQKGYVSLKELNGSIVVQKFCHIFNRRFNEMLIEKIVAEIEFQLLQDWSECFERITEYCTMPGIEHNVKMEFENLRQHEEMLERFQKFVDLNKIVGDEVSKYNDMG